LISREQQKAMFAAVVRKSGISKRELFENDLALRKFRNLPRSEQRLVVDELIKGRDAYDILGIERAEFLGKQKTKVTPKLFGERTSLLNAMLRDPELKSAFIKENALDRSGFNK
jgi:hypothetical protein